jgi:hypothetical protein
MSYYFGQREPSFDYSILNPDEEITIYGTRRKKAKESEKKGTQFQPDTTIYGTKRFGEKQEERPDVSEEVWRAQVQSGSLHSGGGNETLRDLGLRYEAAARRGQYERDNTWVESIIPEISGRSNIVPKIKAAQQSISKKINERQENLIQTKSSIDAAEQAIENAKNIRITVPEKTYGYSWAPYGLYNNEYQYQTLEKSIKIAEAEASKREAENLAKNYEQDIQQAQNLQNLLTAYEREKKFQFLNEYESRTIPYFSEGGLNIPAMTPTGTLKVRMPRSSGKTFGFEAPTSTPLDLVKKPKVIKKDTIMASLSYKPGIPMTRNEPRFKGDKLMQKNFQAYKDQINNEVINQKPRYKEPKFKQEKFNTKRFFG